MMRRVLKRALIAALILAGAVYLWNASWRVAPPENPQIGLIAHRGVHHTFDRQGLENDTCTAERIHPPEHALFENTINSMRAAFAAGADIVELDVHPTTDGHLAVFHDWTIDCRTDGTGETRSHDMAYLKTLDIGYGYTPDGGAAYPLRGQGVGLMPTLDEVLEAIPEGRFIVNFKSNEAREADMVATLFADNSQWRAAVWGAYGGAPPTERAGRLIPGLNIWTRGSLVDCLGQYMLYGWTGLMPDACTDTVVMVPVNVAPWLWGWPNLLQERFARTNTRIILTGPLDLNDPGAAGIDTPDDLARVPAYFSGYIWTNRIEIIGPALTNGG